MTLNDILDIAADGYYDPALLRQSGKFNDNCGDTLALFLAREIRDVYDESLSSEDQIHIVVRAVERARDDVDAVIKALRERLPAPQDDEHKGGWDAVKAAIKAIPDSEETFTPFFWVCGCETNYIHAADTERCLECGRSINKTPAPKDSLLREALLMMIKEAGL